MDFPRSAPLFRAGILTALFASPFTTASAQVVINEIYYDPPNNTTPTEFLELHNPGTTPVDVSNWKVDAGVAFTFPSGSQIAAGGYLVLAQDAAAFQTAFGWAPFGVFTGKLANDGEQVRLRNAANATVDEVTYGAGFPWPTAARGDGSSLELIHPALDNSIAGAWRASGSPVGQMAEQVFVPPVSTTWHYRKGTSEPPANWRALSFPEDASWLTGQTSIGYGDGDDNTLLTDMQNSYSSVYLRRVFNVPAGQIPAALTLRIRVDDGCVVWINGTEIGRFHVPAGALAFNALASDHEADVVSFEEITIPNAASLLVEGNNVIAIQALNASLNSSDFSIDAQLVRARPTTATAPTPGAANSTLSTIAPPAIDTVIHTPLQPAAGQPVTVTARVLRSGSGSIGSVTLQTQSVLPGAYVRKSDPTYETNWTSLAMNDSGLDGDAVAGDSIYTAIVPGTVQTHRKLVRYRITASDGAGNSIRVPYADDQQSNFAYFVSNGLSAWTGAFDPSSTTLQTYTAAFMQTMPAYQLLANAADVASSQYDGSFDGVLMWGTLVYNGKVYDHILYQNRGEFSTYASGKNKWRVRFNTARDFAPLDDWGRPYAETWDTLFLNTAIEPWAAVHHGMCGVEEAVALRFQELAGVATPKSHFVQWRVIDNAAETPSGTQYSGGNPSGTTGGDLWGVYHAIEPIDGSFLDARGLADGNVYKIESNLGDLKHQGATQPQDNSDSVAFRGASGTTQSEAWWRANFDLPTYYSFQAANRALGNVDLREGWNHYFYHNPDGHWTVIPWDLDMMFMPRTHQSGVILQKDCVTVPAIGIEYRNRCRELLDLMLADASVKGGQVGQLIDEYAQLVNPAGQALTWADLDAAMWNKNPRLVSSPWSAQTDHFANIYKTPFTDTRFGGSWVRTLATPDHEGLMAFLLKYTTNTFPTGSTWAVNNGNPLGYGYKYVEAEAADSLIPSRPAPTYTGPAGYPLNDLRFTSSAYSSPQGAATFAAAQWRIAEISAPGLAGFDPAQPRIYELTDVWRSAEIPAMSGETRIPGSSLKTGRTYRIRLRHKDTTGRWSRWSPAAEFTAGAVVAAPYQAALVITKLMYNPSALTSAESAAGFTDKQDFEYVELKNSGASPLDLSSVGFTVGITYAFPAGTTLAAGARIIVAKNVSAFNLRYGSGLRVVGPYTGNLDNSGETITLALGGSSVIRSFAYSDGSHPATGQTADPWPGDADGNGYALVLSAPDTIPNPTLAASWRLSAKPGGNPGADDSITYALWRAQRPGTGIQSADDDGDGLSNLLEYALNTDPKTRTATVGILSSSLKNFTVNGVAASYLTYTVRRQIAATDLIYAIEFSSNVTSWSESGTRTAFSPNGDGTATEEWRDSQPITTGPRFVRLRTTQP